MQLEMFEVEPAEQPEWVELEGSPAQVRWGRSVRAKLMPAVYCLLRERRELFRRRGEEMTLSARVRAGEVLGGYLKATAALENQTSAAWWIRHRENSALELLTGAPERPGGW